MRYKSRRNNQNPFSLRPFSVLGLTLLEMVMVLGAIMILSLITFSAVGAARSLTRRTQCTNNLKQIYSALRLYESDYGRMPPGRVAVSKHRSRSWEEVLHRRGVVQSLFWCPGNKLNRRSDTFRGYRSYSYYHSVFEGRGFPLDPPDNTVLLFCNNHGYGRMQTCLFDGAVKTAKMPFLNSLKPGEPWQVN